MSTVLSWLLTYAIHSTFLILAVWLLHRTVCRSVREREVLWRGALLGGLLTATLATTVLPTNALATRVAGSSWLGGGIAMRDAGSDSDRSRRGERAPGARSGDAPGVDHAALSKGRSGPSETSGKPAPSRDSGVRPTSRDERRAASWTVTARRALRGVAGEPIIAWTLLAALTVGLGLALLRVWRSATAMDRILRNRRPVADADHARRLATTLDELRRLARLRREVRLSTCAGLPGPVSLWWRRAEVVVPEGLPERLRHDEMRCLLAHEVAHLRRRDGVWLLVGLLLRPLALVQPLNFLVLARLGRLAEYACDDWAAEVTGRRVEMASSLAEVARWIRCDRSTLPLPAMARGPSELKVRVERLLAPVGAPDRIRRAAVLVLATLTLTALMPAVPAARDRSRPVRTPDSRGSNLNATANPDLPLSRDALPDSSRAPAKATTQVFLQDVRTALRVLSHEIDALKQEATERGSDPELLDRLADIERRQEELDRLQRMLRRWLATGRFTKDEVQSLLTQHSQESSR